MDKGYLTLEPAGAGSQGQAAVEKYDCYENLFNFTCEICGSKRDQYLNNTSSYIDSEEIQNATLTNSMRNDIYMYHIVNQKNGSTIAALSAYES